MKQEKPNDIIIVGIIILLLILLAKVLENIQQTRILTSITL